jgi:KDO2-lipid IV(A) lauroyltransferase
MSQALVSRCGVWVMRRLAHLPLAWVRTLGWLLGWALYALVLPRRRVVFINLRLCFPKLSQQELRALARQTFIHFAQAWLDRGWLWHGPDLDWRPGRFAGQ